MYQLTGIPSFFFQFPTGAGQPIFPRVHLACRNFKKHLIHRIPILLYKQDISILIDWNDGAGLLMEYHFPMYPPAGQVRFICIHLYQMSLKDSFSAETLFLHYTHITPLYFRFHLPVYRKRYHRQLSGKR